MTSQYKVLLVKIRPWSPLLPWAGFAGGAAVMAKAYLPDSTGTRPLYFWLGLLLFGAILIVMMIFRPAGMIPAQRRKRKLISDGPEIEE